MDSGQAWYMREHHRYSGGEATLPVPREVYAANQKSIMVSPVASLTLLSLQADGDTGVQRPMGTFQKTSNKKSSNTGWTEALGESHFQNHTLQHKQTQTHAGIQLKIRYRNSSALHVPSVRTHVHSKLKR